MGRKIISAILCGAAIATVSGVVFARRAGTDTSLQLNCPPFSKVALPTPTAQSDPHATERFRLINDQAKSRPYEILFLGDSLTEDWDRIIWEQHFSARDALNAGIEGDRPEHLLWRLEHGNLDGVNPKAVVLLIGTNDIGRDRWPELIAEGIRVNLEALRSHLPNARILLLGVLPRSESPSSPRRRQVSEVNRLIKNCNDGDHIFYADIGDALLDPGGRLDSAISPDGVHLSQRGYTLLALHLDRVLDHVLNAGR